MNVSNVSSTDYYSGAISSSTKSTKSDPLQKALQSLESDLESGNTTSASTEVNDILSHAPKTSSSASPTDTSSGTTNSGDQITQYLKSLKSAITAGDTTSAQSVLSKLQDYVTANPPPTPPGGGHAAGSSSANDNPLQKALKSLESDLNSGNTTDATSLLSDIISHTSKNSGNSSTDSNTASTSSSSDTFNTFLKSLKSALSSGDTTSAQSIVTSLQHYLAANQPSQAASAGTYLANGDFNSTTANSSSISVLA
jgi:ribosomal protein S20